MTAVITGAEATEPLAEGRPGPRHLLLATAGIIDPRTFPKRRLLQGQG